MAAENPKYGGVVRINGVPVRKDDDEVETMLAAGILIPRDRNSEFEQQLRRASEEYRMLEAFAAWIGMDDVELQALWDEEMATPWPG